MTEIKMRTILLGMLMFTIITAGLSSFYSNFFVNQGTENIENMSSVKTMMDIRGKSQTMKNRTLSEEPQTWTYKVQVLWTQLTSGVNMVFSVMTMPVTLVSDVYSVGQVGTYLPIWLKIAIEAAVFIIITFVFISAVRRWKM